MPYDHDFDWPPPPTYKIGKNPCYRCSKARIRMEYQYRNWYQMYECDIDELCPRVVECEHFSREPGVD